MVNQNPGSSPTPARMVAVVCLLFFFVYLGNSLWLSLFPNHLLRLEMSSLFIGVALMVYNASLSVTFLPSGRLSDRLGRRPLILAGLLFLALSTLVLSMSSQIEIMFPAIVGAGIGLGLLMPSGNALISDVVHGRGSGLAFAIFQIATLLAAVIGSYVAGALAGSIGFSQLFTLSATVGGSAFVFAYFMIPKTRASELQGYGSALAESLRSSVTGTTRMLRSNRELALLTSALVMHSLGFAMISPFVPLFAEEGIHLDIAQVGIIISTWNAGVAVALIPSGHLTDRLGAKPLLLAHFVLSSLSWTVYTWSWSLQSGMAAMVFFGIVGALDAPARRTIMIDYATPQAGKATIIGSLDAITGIVGTLGPVVGGVVWGRLGYSSPFQLAALLNAFACVPLIAIMRRAGTRSFDLSSPATAE